MGEGSENIPMLHQNHGSCGSCEYGDSLGTKKEKK
jgi:hypothetical protein